MFIDIDNINVEEYFGFVYETVNLINKKKYIGKCIFARKNDWKKYLGSGIYLKRAIDKYGKENFKKNILALATNRDELNRLEEHYIDKFNAVKSQEYYNLKKTALGGDIFTTHPEKERIREMRRKQMSGKGNNQYGKPKTKKMIESVRKANSKGIMVDGVKYSSGSDYRDSSGIKASTLSYRLKSNTYPNYLFLDNDGKPIQKEVRDPKERENNPKEVVVNSVKYKSLAEASRQLEISTTGLRYRINSKKYPSYKWYDKCD